MGKQMLGLVLLIIVLSLSVERIECGTNNYQIKLLQEMIKNHVHLNQDEVGNDEIIRVHLIPHSHDDVGWLKTVDQYFNGDNNDVQRAGIQYTIDAYVNALLEDPKRKFIQVEVAYFWRWWRQQDPALKQAVKGLIQSEQLQFINGGWCMNDEATVYYEDVIDQMTLGHQWLLDELGVRPTVGWQVDPFGHTNSMASLFSQMGFNALIFGRADYQDREVRLEQKSMEFLWKPYQNSGEDYSLLGVYLYNQYQPPAGFCFDILCDQTPIMYDKRLEGYNLPQKAQEFADYFKNMSRHYDLPVLEMTMGGDFYYINSDIWYKQIEALMSEINPKKDYYKIELLYSTPQDYLKEIYTYKKNYPENRDDFLPYADDSKSYWTGYFTSRVAGKGQVRYTGRLLQSLRNYLSLLRLQNESKIIVSDQDQIDSDLFVLEESMAVMQHHDAVTGTAKQYVQNNYYFRLENATQAIYRSYSKVLIEQTKDLLGETVPGFSRCNWNITARECATLWDTLSQNKTVLLSVLNPSQRQQAQIIRIKVPNLKLEVVDQDNNVLVSDILCLNSTDIDDCTLFFQTKTLLPYNQNFFKISVVDKLDVEESVLLEENRSSMKGTFRTAKVHSAEVSNNLTSAFSIKNSQNKSIDLELRFNMYRSWQGSGQKSGAYIFLPDSETTNGSIAYSPIKDQTQFDGKLVKVKRMMSDHVVSYIYEYPGYLELETFVDSIPILDAQGKEIVMIIKSPINNADKKFYTDSNGLEMQERTLNYRPTWRLEVVQESAGNYYPVNGAAYIQDSKDRLAIVNDRSQGFTSLQAGELEIMLHRRILRDDSRGVEESLNESELWNPLVGLRQKFRHFLVYENISEEVHRDLQYNFDTDYVISYAASSSRRFPSKVTPKQNLHKVIPPNVKVNVKFLKNKGQYLLRLLNLGETKTQQVSLENIGFETSKWSAVRVTLTANQNWDTWKQKQYKWNDYITKPTPDDRIKNGIITIKPLENLAFLLSAI